MIRIEKDSLGKVKIPEGAYYGAGTQRALDNFPISSLRFSSEFIGSIAVIKRVAAEVNHKHQRISSEICRGIVLACEEIISGRMEDQFPVDIFQTGSGTSTNMNVNEVVAARGNELLTGTLSGSSPIHPNNHVNLGQSSNDVIPTAIYITSVRSLHNLLLPALETLKNTLEKKELEFKGVEKIGRTHLQDALPMTVGEEFGGYRRQAELSIERISACLPRLTALPLGGTAVGTGHSTDPSITRDIIDGISRMTGTDFREAENHFQAQSSMENLAELSGVLRSTAAALYKISNDIRWLASGPRFGLGELRLPEVQPGSSIMPGKINPVICESAMMAAAKVIANDTSVTLGCLGGNFQLNTMLPLMAHSLEESIHLLGTTAVNLSERCIEGILVAPDTSSRVYQSLALATDLVPYIGYDAAAEIAREAYEGGLTIYQAARDKKILPQEVLEEIFKTQ